MPKGYWISAYRGVKNEDALASYAKIAGPAVQAFGGRFLARGNPTMTYEAGDGAERDIRIVEGV